MKTLRLMTIGMMLFFASSSMNGQVSVSVNIGVPPPWGPVGYASVNYYYLPDIECYYDVRATQFIYLSGGVWVRSSYLPRYYRDYDLHRGYKVVLKDYHGSRPYANYRYDRVKYYKGYRGAPQKSVKHKGGNDYIYYKDNHDNHHGNSNKHGDKGNKGNGNKHKH
ncbi:MAG TPA: hypothetical protein VIV55_12115 [Flavobacterium sp.]